MAVGGGVFVEVEEMNFASVLAGVGALLMFAGYVLILVAAGIVLKGR